MATTPEPPEPPDQQGAPSLDLTVAIPTWNGCERLPDLLASLRRQPTDRCRWEVLVVDNGSSDATPILLREHPDELLPGVPFRWIREPRPGVANARQAAIDAARAPLVAFLDDDTRPRSGWVEGAVRAFERHPKAVAVNGRIQPVFEVEPPLRFHRIESFFALVERGETDHRFDPQVFDLPPGAGLVVRRQAWLERVPRKLRQSGASGNDFEALLNLSEGGEIWYSPDLCLEHHIDAYRLEQPYLRRMMREAGRPLCYLRLIGKSRWSRPRVVLEVFVGSSLRALRVLATSGLRRDLVARCELRFWWAGALSPLELLRRPQRVPQLQRIRG